MFARTERLLLRPGWREDADSLSRTIADPRIVRNLAQAPWPYGRSDAEAFLARERGPDEPACLIHLRTRAAPRLIGAIGLAPVGPGVAELGYWIAPDYWGLGFATEAGRAMVDHARHSLRLKRLTAGHFLDNPASGRVLAKLGFRSRGEIVARHSLARGGVAQCREFELGLGNVWESRADQRGSRLPAPLLAA